LRLFSFGSYGLALAALALVVFGAYDSYPISPLLKLRFKNRMGFFQLTLGRSSFGRVLQSTIELSNCNTAADSLESGAGTLHCGGGGGGDLGGAARRGVRQVDVASAARRWVGRLRRSQSALLLTTPHRN